MFFRTLAVIHSIGDAFLDLIFLSKSLFPPLSKAEVQSCRRINVNVLNDDDMLRQVSIKENYNNWFMRLLVNRRKINLHLFAQSLARK